MANSKPSKISTGQKEDQHASSNRRHDATLISSGPPALYRLNTEKKNIDGTDGKVRRWTYGRRDRNKQNKVILIVGETGSGKTTMINTMINHLLRVKFEDQEFYQITEEEENKDQSQSQTRVITVYEMFVEENPTSLTIIDTPGYGDTGGLERDEETSQYMFKLFSDNDVIDYLDAVCFVMKASQNRLSGKELYIFHSVLSLFGRDIENNIVFLLTQSGGGPPTDALNAIKTAEIPCRINERGKPVHFLFNNQQKEKRDEEYEDAYRSSWEMGERNMNRFLKLLEENNRKSVEMTSNVLKERRRLEACISNLMDRINEKELKTKELIQIQEALRQNRDTIKRCENFEITVDRSYKEKVPIVNESRSNSKATCCSVCEENCHEWDCSWAINASWCYVMKKRHCTVCTRKCQDSKHIKENKKYVTKTKKVTITYDNLKQEYEHTMKDSKIKTEMEEKLKSDLEKNKAEKSKLLDEAYISIMKLCKIALKADSAFTLQHLDYFIFRLKEEGKVEWMKNLEDLSKAGEEQKNKGAVQHLKAYGGKN